jgi:acetyl-CoA synthetase
MLAARSNYEETRQNFLWKIPDYYNIGVDVCDKWAESTPSASALVYVTAEGTTRSITFLELRDLSNRLANVLKSSGIRQGDRVGILLPQAPETAYAHIAIYKLGAIAVPLFSLFGQVALEFRLADAGVRALITDAESVDKTATGKVVRRALRDRAAREGKMT